VQLINTGPEPFFEDVVNHMAAICAVPVAMIAIAEPRRQWINRPGQEKGAEAPRAMFSVQEKLGTIKAIVNDMALEEHLRGIAFSSDGPQIHAFICVPLVVDGAEIGNLYLADVKPRAWSEFEISYMARSSRLVAGHFEARAMLAERSRRIELERQLAEANALYRAVVAAMNEGVIVRSARGDVVLTNEAARTILGVNESQIRSRTPGDERWRILDADGRPLPPDQRPTTVALATGQAQVQKLVGIERPNGEIRWAYVNATPMWTGMSLKPTAVVTTFDDVTEKYLDARARKVAG
jgi:PAS domain S-box-containing protein